MAKKRNKIVDYVAYLGVRLFAMTVHIFRPEASYAVAGFLGNCLYRFDKRHRHRGIEHLRRSFPDWPQEKYERVTRASMRSLVYLALEVILTTRLVTPTSWQRYVRLLHMPENVRLLTERNRPLIFVTGHLGNWEVLGYTLATLGFHMYAIARPLDNPYLNEYILGFRQKTGLTILDKKGATEQVDEILANNGVVGFIADQDAGRKGLFVDFFGRKASTYKSIGLLAMQYNACVIVGYGHRLVENYRFEIGIERIIYPEEWADKDQPLEWITQEYSLHLENAIRRYPEQYLWAHRRWKHRPEAKRPAKTGSHRKRAASKVGFSLQPQPSLPGPTMRRAGWVERSETHLPSAGRQDRHSATGVSCDAASFTSLLIRTAHHSRPHMEQ